MKRRAARNILKFFGPSRRTTSRFSVGIYAAFQRVVLFFLYYTKCIDHQRWGGVGAFRGML